MALVRCSIFRAALAAIALAGLGCLRAATPPADAGPPDGGAADGGMEACGDGACDFDCPCPADLYCELALEPCGGGETSSSGGVCRAKSPCDGGDCLGQACSVNAECGVLLCDGGLCTQPSPQVGNASCASGCALIVPAHSATPTCVCHGCPRD